VARGSLPRELLDQGVFGRWVSVVPPIVFLSLIPFALATVPPAVEWLIKGVAVYALITAAGAINAVWQFVYDRYDSRVNTEQHPLKGVLNLGKGIVWGVITIIGVSVVIGRSPAALLTGLGAFAAALMLIFKDSILGFVAGVQLSQNDMLRVGDWIEVPGTGANGFVADVSLSVVKVRNWDNTVTMLPPYSLVSASFTNWRGMIESGCRRVTAAIYIDSTSVAPLAEGEAELLARRFEPLRGFVGSAVKGCPTADAAAFAVNGSVDTNLGLFRAYLCAYLLGHPGVARQGMSIVRLMPATGSGTPLQLYFFTTDVHWPAYEAIQSGIVEHAMATAPAFGLRVYNRLGGPDLNVAARRHETAGADAKAGPDIEANSENLSRE
jgi:miniconductance mechanosensitive channel